MKMQYFIPATIILMTCLVILICCIVERRRQKKRNTNVIREFIDKYGYDDIDSEETARKIYRMLNKKRKFGMTHQEFEKIADQVTDPYIDPAKDPTKVYRQTKAPE